MGKPANPPEKAFAGLEVCRILCAIAVILWHYQHFFFTGALSAPAPVADREHYPFYRIFALAYNHGFFAVSIFWVISGFIFYWKYSEPIHARTTDGAKFAMLRFSRLYPLHFTTLILVAVLQYTYFRSHGATFIYPHNDARHFIAQLFFATNWFSASESFNGPAWSVSVEILVYGLFFGLLFWARASILQCLLLVGAANMLLHFNFREPVIACTYFFFAGGLLQRVERLIRAEHRKFAFLCAVLVVAALLTLLKLHWILETRTIRLALAVAIVISFVLADQVLPALHKIAWLGNLTYSSYLIHFSIQLCLVMAVDAFGIPRTLFLSPLVFLCFFSLTFGLAWVVYHAYEMPAQNAIRARWFAGIRRRALAV